MDALNQSLSSRDADKLSPEWQAEIERRIEAIENGESKLIPLDEVEARIRRTLHLG